MGEPFQTGQPEAELIRDSVRLSGSRRGGALRYNAAVLIVVSPAKSLDFESAPATKKRSRPRMLDRSAELVSILAAKSQGEIGSLMSLSPQLAELNAERFSDWQPAPEPGSARQAVLAFDGDTYRGLDAPTTFGERDFAHAQKTLRILSGLYGVLRPLDEIQPYRLEMGTKLINPRGEDLYDFWGDQLTQTLRADLAASPGSNALLNLASNEYFRAVKAKELDTRVVTPSFLDATSGGEPKMVSFYAKRARGAMSGWIIRERVKSVRALQEFDGLGYAYDADLSSVDAPVFVRSR
jgi:cytoplasmic iron level regulating protein YaaA (DUF328/UPF0246 family)